MSIAILGTGNMGKALARRLAGKAEFVVGSRSGTPYADAIRGAQLVVLAMPYAAALETAGQLDLGGKVVLDMSNPITPDFSNLLFGHTTSAAEEIAKVAPRARVVKAFNTIFAALLDALPAATARTPVFIAGDDPAAVAAVADLTERAGFAADPIGGLERARLLEALGMLNIHLGYGLGRGTSIAPAWLAV